VLPGLDGLRAVAALLVVGFHLTDAVWPLNVGWAGVPIFFVLSGYLITRLSRADETGTGFSFRSFWIRRVTRIIPLYLLALCAFMLLPFLGQGGGWSTVARTLPWYLTFNGEYVQHGPMTVAWSLGIEEKFYLLWPVIAFALLAGRRVRLPLTAAGAAVCLAIAATTDVPNIDGYAALLVGATIALLEDRAGWVGDGMPSALARPSGGWLAAAAVVAALLGANLPADQGWTYVALSLATAALILHLVHGRSAVNRLLSTTPMRWLGRRSYGIYLIHTLALTVAVKVVPGGVPLRTLWVGLGCLLLTFAASDIAHRLLETPCIRWGRRWADRPRAARAPVHAAQLTP
jgi:peptidoglycan/LPS O-acetylase OafA/YrhL